MLADKAENSNKWWERRAKNAKIKIIAISQYNKYMRIIKGLILKMI